MPAPPRRHRRTSCRAGPTSWRSCNGSTTTGSETSGTAFFAFGIAYGITAGLLDRATYLPVAARAWNGMVATAVRADGQLGYSQTVDTAPAPVDPNQTADFGVGAFLMAGAEIAALTA
jgi:rhamnogalacturonyl hydrolase YesR